MLKFITVLSILLVLASSRSLSQEDVCKVENQRHRECHEKSLKDLMTRFNGSQYPVLSSTSAPNKRSGIEHLKQDLECVGEITCNGSAKFMVFLFETRIFADEQLHGNDVKCIEESDLEIDLEYCLFINVGRYIKQQNYNDDILKCAERILQEMECNSEEKRAIMRAAHAENDFLKLVRMKNAINVFDKKFDSTKYIS